jgi:hemoglobin
VSQSEPPELPVFQLLGEAGISALVRGFYRRVQKDPVLARLYPEDDLAGAEQRLRDFLVYRFGGPPRYIQERGHPRLRLRHMPFAIDVVAREHWLAAMTASMTENGLDPGVAAYLQRFFTDVGTFLINR